MKKAPGGLIAISVIAIVLGVFGVFGAGLGAVGAVAGQAMQEAFQPANQPANPLQDEMQREMKKIQDKWAPVNYTLLAVQFAVAVWLVIGGIQTLRLQPIGYRLLLLAFIAAIGFELVRLIPTVSIQMATMDVMEQYMADMMQQAPPGGAKAPPGVNRIVQNSMKVGLFIGLAFTGFWLLLKLGFYGYGAWYLKRPRIAALFDGDEQPADMDWDDEQA